MASSGCYLLAVVAEPVTNEERDIILRRLSKGLLSWDVNATGCDLKGIESICTAVKEKDAQDSDVLIQYSTESLGVEILVNPPVSTLKQCMKNLLTSTISHKHIIHAGYTFTGSGSWILQNGTYSFRDFSDGFQEVRSVSPRGSTIHIHCVETGDWTTDNLSTDVFSKIAKISLNPADKLDHLPGSEHLIDCLESVLSIQSLSEIMEASPLVGNIRFNRPTLYLFPAGEGDCALFGINGFNMLIDGGFNRKPCSWEFIRHLDRLDAVLVTQLSESNLCSLSTLMMRKTINNTYPQIGYVFCNIAEGQHPSPAEEIQKDKDDLLVSVVGEGHKFINTLNDLKLVPHQCWRDSVLEPFVLYHKVGHGTLEMHILSPPKDSKEMINFLAEWSSYKERFSCVKGRISPIPLTHATSVCAILVWRPNDPKDTITRILFPGSAPQNRIFEGLDKLKSLEIFKHPTVTKASTSPMILSKPKATKAPNLATKAIPNRKNTASPALSVTSIASRNGDIKKDIIPIKDNRTVKEVKKGSKELKKEVKAIKEIKKEVKKEPKKDKELSKKESKPVVDKPKVVTKKTETVVKAVTEVKKTTAPKKTVKKDVTAKAPKAVEIKVAKVTETKTAKEASNKKAAETKTKPKAKAKTTAAKTKPTPVPKSPSKLSRAIAASAAVATAAVAVGVAELIESKREEAEAAAAAEVEVAEAEEVLKVEITEPEVKEIPEQLQNGIETAEVEEGVDGDEEDAEDEEDQDRGDLNASPARPEVVSPALSEPISLTASDTLSSAPMETVSPTPPIHDMASPAEEKEVNEIKEIDQQTPVEYECKQFAEEEEERVPTPVYDDDGIESPVDEGIEENHVDADDDIPETVDVKPQTSDPMTTSFIGETLELAEEEKFVNETAVIHESVPSQFSDTQALEDVNNQFASATMEGSFCAGYAPEQETGELSKPVDYGDIPTEMKTSMYEEKEVDDEGFGGKIENQYDEEQEDQGNEAYISDRVSSQIPEFSDKPYFGEANVKEEFEKKSDNYELENYQQEVMSYNAQNDDGLIQLSTIPNFEQENVMTHELEIEETVPKSAHEVEQISYDQDEQTDHYEEKQIYDAPPIYNQDKLNIESIEAEIHVEPFGEQSNTYYDEDKYIVEGKHHQEEKDRDSAEDEIDDDDDDEMIRHPTPPKEVEKGFYEDVDEMRDPIGPHFIPPSAFMSQEEPLYEESEDVASNRSESPVVDQPVFGSVEKPDFPELVTVSGGTTPSEPQSPKSPQDAKKGAIGTLEVMDALSEHDCSESSTHSPLVKDDPINTFDIHDEVPTRFQEDTYQREDLSKKELDENSAHYFHSESDVLQTTDDARLGYDYQSEFQHHYNEPEQYELEQNQLKQLEDLETNQDSELRVLQEFQMNQQEAELKQSNELQQSQDLQQLEEIQVSEHQSEFSEIDTIQQNQPKDELEQHDELSTCQQQNESVSCNQLEECSIDYQDQLNTGLKSELQEDMNLNKDVPFAFPRRDLEVVGFTETPRSDYDSDEESREIPSVTAEDTGNEIMSAPLEFSQDTPKSDADYVDQYSHESSALVNETYEQSNRYSSASTVELDNSKHSSENVSNIGTCDIEPQNTYITESYQDKESDLEHNLDIEQNNEDVTAEIPASFSNGYDNHGETVTQDDDAIPITINGKHTYASELAQLGAIENDSVVLKEDNKEESKTAYITDSHYQSDSPESDHSMKPATPEILSQSDSENEPQAFESVNNKYLYNAEYGIAAAPLPVGNEFDVINNKYMYRDEYKSDNMNNLSTIPPQPHQIEEAPDDQERSFVSGNVSPYAYTNEAYNQEDDADGNHIYKPPGTDPQDTVPSYGVQNTEYESTGMTYSPGYADMHTADFRLEEWGKPMGLPTPPEPSTKTKKPMKPTSIKSAPKEKNGKSSMVATSKLTNSPSKKAKDSQDCDSKPVYVDLAYVPHHGDPNYSNVEFFKKIRARYYVFSGIGPSKEVLNALLEAKKSWKEELEVTIIPTYETDTLGYWLAQNQEALAANSIEVAPSASRCTVNLQDHETSCAAYRLEF